MADERSQQTDLARAEGIGILDAVSRDQTVEWLLTFSALDDEPAPGLYRKDLVERALAALMEDGLDVTGESWQPASISVRAGGR